MAQIGGLDHVLAAIKSVVFVGTGLEKKATRDVLLVEEFTQTRMPSIFLKKTTAQ